MLLTLATMGGFIFYRNHIMIEAAGFSYSFTVLLGIFLSFMSTLIHLGEPNDGSCSFQPWFVGFSWMLVIGFVLLFWY
jgi:hypothetical protein